ncbi:MAG: D-isomer specific 2-hydroxyacid dehydrogenase NAD-binding protein [Patescibacteria group bacterium]|nr:D-isomer specific 2-hydroxyacid dehydrogenase NAD-binding protein [Patescibacteria group bacterium]
MKIAFYEMEDWENSILKERITDGDITFSEAPLTLDSQDIAEIELLSIFIYSELNSDLLQKMPKLKMIATRSTGYDHIDIEYCKEKGIIICNVPEYGTQTVAEHTFALLLALSRKIVPSVERTQRNDFSLDNLMGFDLYKKTIGVIGAGNIGKAVIKIANGFGMDVLVYSRSRKMELAQELGFMYVDFEHLLKQSDILTFHTPLTDETKHMLNMENISLLKKGSVILNTSRGGIIETEALLTALDSGQVSAAGIDVLEEECHIKEERQLLTKEFLKECDIKTQLLNHVLLTRENVIVTPHNGFNSKEALERILHVTADNINYFLKQKPQNVV